MTGICGLAVRPGGPAEGLPAMLDLPRLLDRLFLALTISPSSPV